VKFVLWVLCKLHWHQRCAPRVTWLREQLKRLRSWLVGRELEDVAFSHWLPPDGSMAHFQVGEDRCFYCLVRVSDDEFLEPCPRRRPDQVELA
jgi:hypothetical protein